MKTSLRPWVLHTGMFSSQVFKLHILRVSQTVPVFHPSFCQVTLCRFTYAIAFPAFTIAIAGDLVPPRAIDGGILFLLVPIVIVFINGLGVRVCIFGLWHSLTRFLSLSSIQLYGFLELVGGSIKMAFALAIIICMCALNAGGKRRGDFHWIAGDTSDIILV